MQFKPHYSHQELQAEIERFEFPSTFLFGTSTSGYQSEGGFNGAGDPKNNWYYVEADGSMETTGPASRFWELYPEDLEYAERMGCNSFRMGIEWSRVQPEADPESRKAPPFDASSIEQYADILAGCKKRGMEPLVTLFHFTHPLWLGLDPWLDRDRMLHLFNEYVDHTVRAVNERLVSHHGTGPISYYITLNEPAMVPLASYLLHVHPKGKGKKGRKDFATSFENFILAHVGAYKKIHEIYEEKGWERPVVTMNGWASAVYPMDLAVLDILHGPSKGVGRESFPEYLKSKETSFYKKMDSSPCRKQQNWQQRMLEKLIARIMKSKFDAPPMQDLIDRVLTEKAGAPWLDVLAFDFYDPFVGNLLDSSSAFRFHLNKDPWEWNVVPEGLGGFLDSYASLGGGMPLHIVENGMAYAFRKGRGENRRDGADRVEVLKAHLFECLKARNRGRPLEAYFYWTLVDNYEWGSFIPRFGMLSVDYDRGAKRSPLDAVGNNAAGAYQAILKAFFARDRDLLKEAFLSKNYPLLFPDE